RLRVGGVHRQVDAPGVLVQRQDVPPGAPAVGGLEEAALLAGLPQVAQGGDVGGAGVLRVDDDAADVARGAQPGVGPGLPAVGGAVDPVAPGNAVAGVGLAGADPDHVGVGRGHGDGPDRGDPLVVE